MTGETSLEIDPKHDLRVPVGVAKWPFFVLNAGVFKAAFEGRQRGQRAFLHLKAKDEKIGLATVADIDVIAWATSAYTKILNSGRTLPRTLQLNPARFLRFCRRPAGGRQHHLLDASLGRLANTSVGTNLSSDGTLRPFEWIEFMRRPSPGRHSYELHFGGWLKEAVEQRQITKIAPDLLRFRGLQRRLFLWSCGYAGNGRYERYTLALADAYRRSGSQTPIRKFLYELRGLVEAQGLPGFALSIDAIEGGEHLVITRTAERPIEFYETCDLARHGKQMREMQRPPELIFDAEEPPASPLEDLTWNFVEEPEVLEPPPPFSLTVDQGPDGAESDAADPAVVPTSPPARTANPASANQSSINTPLATGRTRRNTYL